MPILVFIFCFQITILAYLGLRLLFLLWNHSFYFQQATLDIFKAFVYGLRFDLSAISILAIIPFFLTLLIALIYKKHPKPWLLFATAIIFWLPQFPFLILNYVDAEFVNFLGRRYTVDALVFAQEAPGKVWQILGFYWKLSLANLITFLVTGYFMLYFVPRKIQGIQFDLNLKKISALAFTIFAALAIASRGGLQSKPINFAHAQIFLNPAMNNLVLNSSFTFIQTIVRKPLARDKFFNDDEMLRLVKAGTTGPSLLDGQRPGKPNIVLIILESFALEYMGKPHGGDGYTPFLDELADRSLFFPNAFANARRSIEGIGAIVGGVPALMNEPFISSQYMTNYFQGLGTEMQLLGYDTGFFHGAKDGSMYFDQFMKAAGMKKYFALNEYPDANEYDGTWGIWDEPFLQFAAHEMDSFAQPFLSAIFTLTSHNPFHIPEKYVGKFPKGTLDIHESLGYADYALRKFFETAETKPWFENTIFLITADHTYKSFRRQYQNEMGNYRVPFLIYSPKIRLPKVDTEQVVQHIDIMPTILDLVGLKPDKINLLGRSVFIPGDRTAISFIDNRYLFIAKDYFLQMHQGEEAKMFSISDPSATKPLVEPADRKHELEQRMKAQIQYFSQGLWDNKLYYPTGQQ